VTRANSRSIKKNCHRVRPQCCCILRTRNKDFRKKNKALRAKQGPSLRTDRPLRLAQGLSRVSKRCLRSTKSSPQKTKRVFRVTQRPPAITQRVFRITQSAIRATQRSPRRTKRCPQKAKQATASYCYDEKGGELQLHAIFNLSIFDIRVFVAAARKHPSQNLKTFKKTIMEL
jgi:hypothetical protein